MTQDPRWSDSLLDAMRQTGDPVADVVIEELFSNGEVAAVNALMRTLIANEYAPVAGLPPVVADYLSRSQQLPDWADPSLIKEGEQIFWQFGPELIVILTCYALPFCYLGKNGVPVLALTTRLMSNPARRVLETAQMVVDVMQPGGLTSAGGRALRTLQKVRLMHAAVRHLAPRSPDWKPEYGVPINQEDLAGTLLAFSYIGLEGLRKMGIEVAPSDQEAFLHCWRIVGTLLGLQPAMIPANVEEAGALTAAISRREFAPTAYGVEMTTALLNMLAGMIPGDLLRHTPRLMLRYFLGEEWAKWLGIEESAWVDVAAAPLRFFGLQCSDVLNDFGAIRKLAQHLGKLIIGSIVFVERAGNRPSFAIPAELREQWGVNWTS